MGDIVHTLPILRLLRRRFIHSHIAWLVAPAFEPLIKRHPDLSETILFDRRGLGDVSAGEDGMARAIDLACGLRDRHFDLVIDFQGLLRTGLIAWSTHAPTRIGFAYAREGATLAYTHLVDTPHHERHAIERYLDIAEALGCPRGPIEYDFAIDSIIRAQTRAMLADDSPFAVFLPGTNWETKRWPVLYFANLATRLRAETGLRIVIAGAKDALPLAAQIPHDLNLTDRTTLPQLVALLERASVVIANDSGPMHIAAALDRPLVTIFGPTNPVRTGPYLRPETVLRLDIACSPCYSRKCSHTSCMNWLTPDAVLEEVRGAISNLS